MNFKGRSLSVVKDLSVAEQIFLYTKTRDLKAALKANDTTALQNIRVSDENVAVYLIFMENSTRTKESFRNAALFHHCKVNTFDCTSSSFKKGETIADTLRMLCGYSVGQSVFVMRTKLEGVCTAMRDTIGDYCDKMGLPRASFINGGDGKHEHPTQEFLDEFTFLEHNNWDRSRIHVALVGDLLHGRTVHSKVEGLRIYDSVTVDLIAPSELQMPSDYVDEMRRNGYTVRTYTSIDEYVSLGKDHVAPMWYFTRLQLERLGDDILAKESALRRAITFREEFYSKIDDSRTKFYHPLPRHAEFPEIPPYLDSTPLNGWEQQSMNGYFTRIIELAMVMGKFDTAVANDDSVVTKTDSDDVAQSQSYITERPISNRTAGAKQPDKLHIKQISNGVVIDHIGMNLDSTELLWKQMSCIHRVLDIKSMGSEGVFPSKTSSSGFKALISLPDFPLDYFTPPRRKMLAAISPGCTLSVIKDNAVVRKFQMEMPPKIYNFRDISCRNIDCISHKQNHQNVMVRFDRAYDVTFRCHYCDREHLFSEIWRDFM
eukprot:PhM_4_TR18713/c2_g1_i1/m.62287/K00608/pyrBI; aspartate carbamoyltransferase